MRCARCGRSFGGKQEMSCPHREMDTSKFYNKDEDTGEDVIGLPLEVIKPVLKKK